MPSTSTATAMKSAVTIAKSAGYHVEDVPALRGAEWHKLLEKADNQKTRDCIQALRWTGGDLPALYKARDAQKKKRAEVRKAYLNSK